jgi:hypothetical protein
MKTDNDEFIRSHTANPSNQLALSFDVPVEEKTERAKNPDFEKFLAELRQEAKDILDIANSLSGDKFQNQKEIPNNILAIAVGEYHKRNNIVRIEIVRTPNNKKSKPYSPWSDDRKHKDRLRKLHIRLSKKWCINELRFTALLDECAKNPQYFGLCLLPNASDRCPCSYPSPATIAARQKEMLSRN